MRKFIVFILSAILVMSLAACAPTKRKVETSAPDSRVMASTGGASDKVPDPNVEPMEIISIYNLNDDNTGLNQAMDAVDKLTAEAMVDKLIEYHVLEEGTKVLKFEITDGTGILDLSQVPQKDADRDFLVIASVGNTFIENFEIDKLQLLINGKNYKNEKTNQDYLEFVKDYKKVK